MSEPRAEWLPFTVEHHLSARRRDSVSRIAVTVIGTHLVMDYGTHEAAQEAMAQMQSEAAPPPLDGLDVERLAHKAAQIGFTYGALGRDFEYVYKNVNDMLAEEQAALRDEGDTT